MREDFSQIGPTIGSTIATLERRWRQMGFVLLVSIVPIVACTLAFSALVIGRIEKAFGVTSQSGLREVLATGGVDLQSRIMIEQLASAVLWGLVIGAILLVLLDVGTAAMIRAARHDEPLSDSIRSGLMQLGRHGVQATLLATGSTIVLLILAMVTSAAPMLVWLAVIVWVPTVAVLVGLFGLNAVDCADGSKEWMPRASVYAVRDHPVLVGGTSGALLVASTVPLAISGILPLLSWVLDPALWMLTVATFVAMHDRIVQFQASPQAARAHDPVGLEVRGTVQPGAIDGRWISHPALGGVAIHSVTADPLVEVMVSSETRQWIPVPPADPLGRHLLVLPAGVFWVGVRNLAHDGREYRLVVDGVEVAWAS